MDSRRRFAVSVSAGGLLIFFAVLAVHWMLRGRRPPERFVVTKSPSASRESEAFQLSGRIETDAGIVPPDVAVSVLDEAGRAVAAPPLRGDTFECSGLDPGDYLVRAVSATWGEVAESVTVPQEAALTIRYKASSTLEVTLVGAEPSALARARLKIAGPCLSGPKELAFKEDRGTYRASVAPLCPGRYYISGFVWSFPVRAEAEVPRNGETVAVAIDVRQPQPGVLRGAAYLGDLAHPLRRVELRLRIFHEGREGGTMAETDDRGEFEARSLSLVPGATVRFSRGDGLPTREITYSGPEEFYTVVFDELRHRDGLLLDADGIWLPYCHFSLVSWTRPGPSYRKRSDRSGRFEAGDLEPGEYSAEPYEPWPGRERVHAGTKATRVTVLPGDDRVEIRLETRGCLAIRVVWPGGERVVAYGLRVAISDGSGATREFWKQKAFRSGIPDPDPNATCLCEVLRPDGVTEGEAEVLVSRGWGARRFAFDPSSGSVPEVEVELTPAEPVDVTVVDPGGAPVTDAAWSVPGFSEAFGIDETVASDPEFIPFQPLRRGRWGFVYFERSSEGVYRVWSVPGGEYRIRVRSAQLNLAAEVLARELFKSPLIVLEKPVATGAPEGH